MAIERRLTEVAGPVGRRLHTARSRNDQVATDLALYTRERAPEARAVIGGADGERCWSARASTSTGRCPATRTCSAPSPCTSATTCSPTSGCSTRDRERFAFAARQAGRLPLGAGALAGVNFDTDRALLARELGLLRGRAQLDRRRLRTRLRARLPERRRDLRDAPLAPGRRARALVERRVRLLRAARRVELGLVDHAAEEEPRRRRAAARQGPPRGRSPGRACTGCCTGCALTYNKDLQEDKEHLFDAVDTLALALAAATRDDRRRALRSRAHARGGLR